jgi:hypothetical protein
LDVHPLGGASGLLGMISRHKRDRLAPVADDIER